MKLKTVRNVWRRIRGPGAGRRVALVPDFEIAVGNKSATCTYRTDIDKEKLSRQYIFGLAPDTTGRKRRFLDVGGRDGKLNYLLGNIDPLRSDPEMYAENLTRFCALYDYYGLDLRPAGKNVLVGDICEAMFAERNREILGSFDVVYSNNVFEHFERPWIAAQNIMRLLKIGGICITIVPFAQRYHEDPGDYYRYTPSGVEKLFASAGSVRVRDAGFDIRARRYDWQGQGDTNDIVPVDRFGAWRETWFTVVVLEAL